LLFVFNTQKSTILKNFCNPKILKLKYCQSQDSGMVKTVGIQGFKILGLQFLVMTDHY